MVGKHALVSCAVSQKTDTYARHGNGVLLVTGVVRYSFVLLRILCGWGAQNKVALKN